jgi:hypothetical protein
MAGADGILAITSPSPPESLSPFPLPFPQSPTGGADGTAGRVNPKSGPDNCGSYGAFALMVFRRDLKSEGPGTPAILSSGIVGVADSDSEPPRSLSLPDNESMSLPVTLSGRRASLLRLAFSQSSSADDALPPFPPDGGASLLMVETGPEMRAVFTEDDLTCNPDLSSALNLGAALLGGNPVAALLARRLTL